MKNFLKSLVNMVSIEETIQPSESDTNMVKIQEHVRNKYNVDFLVIQGTRETFDAFAFTQQNAQAHRDLLEIPKDVVVPLGGVVYIGRKAWSTNVLAHELGHLVVNKKTGMDKFDTLDLRAASKAVMVTAGLLKMFRKASTANMVTGAAIIWASEVPRLAEEAAASYFGRKMLRELGIEDDGTMSVAYATYVRGAALAPMTINGLAESFYSVKYRYFTK